MRRFYQDDRRAVLALTVSIVCFIILAFFVVRGVNAASIAAEQEGIKLAEDAVRRTAVSLYALDGRYPASWSEFKEKSSIQIDEDKYVVFYSCFAPNFMPEINVHKREGGL